MKQLFPKALFYKEWKNARWGLALFAFFLFYSKLFYAIQGLSFLKEVAQSGNLVVANNEYWFQQLMYGDDGVFVLLAILTVPGLCSFRQTVKATASLMNSMPLQRTSFQWKWITVWGHRGGFSSDGLLLTGFYFANRSWMLPPLSGGPTWIVLFLAFTLALFSFCSLSMCHGA